MVELGGAVAAGPGGTPGRGGSRAGLLQSWSCGSAKPSKPSDPNMPGALQSSALVPALRPALGARSLEPRSAPLRLSRDRPDRATAFRSTRAQVFIQHAKSISCLSRCLCESSRRTGESGECECILIFASPVGGVVFGVELVWSQSFTVIFLSARMTEHRCGRGTNRAEHQTEGHREGAERGTERGTEGVHATECVYSGQHTEGEPDRVSG